MSSSRIEIDCRTSYVKREPNPTECRDGECGVAGKDHACLVRLKRRNWQSVARRAMRIEYHSSTFCVTRDTYSTMSRKRQYGELRLSHVCSALRDRHMGPSVAREGIVNKVSVLHASS